MLLIVCYSLTGKSLAIAGKLAAVLDAECLQIQDARDRKGVLGFIRSGYESTFRRFPAIRPFEPPLAAAGLERYEGIILLAPVWAGKICSPLRTFLKTYGAGVRKYALILTCGDPVQEYQTAWQEVQAIINGENRFNATLFGDAPDLEKRISAIGQSLLAAFPE